MGLEPEPEPSPSPAGCPCEAEILRDGGAITDSNRNVQVGDKITLKVKCGDCALSDFEWTIPGTIFKDFQPSKARGRITQVPAGDLEKQEFFFYWSDAADGRNVSCKFKAEKDGKKENCTAEATLNVKRPTVTFSATIGTYDKVLMGALSGLRLLPNAGHTHGIEFSGDVRILDGFDFSPGKWNAVQLLTINSHRKLLSTLACERHHLNEQTVLDTDYPYQPPPVDPAAGWPGAWDANIGASVHTWDDDPANTLGADYATPPPTNAYTDATFREDFTTYIMYKPSSPDSRWVSLQKINWWVNACLYHGTGTGPAAWTFGGSFTDPANRSYATEAVNETDHPLWEAYYTRGWVSAACPAFCRP